MSENKEAKADWEIREDGDDALITSDDIVTEIQIFPQTKKPYLTLVGLFAMANREKITVTKMDIEETEMSYRVLCEGKNPDGEVRYGGHEEFKGTNATHAYAKAVSKAQRNLFKAFLYGNATVKEAFAKYAEANPNGQSKPVDNRRPQQRANGNQRQQAREQKPVEIPLAADDNRIHTIAEMEAEPVPTEKERGAYLRRYVFAVWNEHNPDTGDGRLPANFWDNVKDRYTVESRADMTVSQWQACLERTKDSIKYAKPGTYAPATDFSVAV